METVDGGSMFGVANGCRSVLITSVASSTTMISAANVSDSAPIAIHWGYVKDFLDAAGSVVEAEGAGTSIFCYCS